MRPIVHFNQHWPQGFDLIDEIFKDFHGRSLNRRLAARDLTPCKFDETDSHYLLSLDLPGVDKKDLQIDLIDGYLSVVAERSATLGKGEAKERLERTFKIPRDLNEDSVEANLQNGVLSLAIAKPEAKKPKRIEIKSENPGFFSRLLGGQPETSPPSAT